MLMQYAQPITMCTRSKGIKRRCNCSTKF